jgi:hypothetical protein
MKNQSPSKTDLLSTLPNEVYDRLLHRAINIREMGHSHLELDAIMVKLHIEDLKIDK